jgi:beta-xylosidase
MNTAGTRVLDDGAIVFDGHATDPTVEGPKFYKLGGWYYILAPAGGVATGWQLALRSRNIYGPYDKRVVLAQGDSSINGPHQGGLIDTALGEWWFLHFQEKGPYGRVVHLQPVKWKNGFPVIGDDADGDGTGQPLSKFKKPNVGIHVPIETIQDSDEFTGPQFGSQWQWHADPKAGWAFLFPQKGVLKMFSVQRPAEYRNLWDVPNLLLQKFPAEEFTATAKVQIDERLDSERFGLLVMGLDYSYIAIERRAGKAFLIRGSAHDADKGTPEVIQSTTALKSETIYLRVTVRSGAFCSFSYSNDGTNFADLGDKFRAREGRWIGAKIGFFFTRDGQFNDSGYADIDWFRFEK